MKQILRIPRHLDAPQELILVRLLVTMGAAAMVATSSLYLSSLGMSDGQIGVATGIVMAINLVFALTLPFILEKFRLYKILIGSTLSFAVTLVLFGSTNTAFLALALYVVARLLLSLFASSYSILFHDDSKSPRDFMKNQALLGSLNNFSWTIMPFFATLIIDQFSFQFLYIVVGSIALVASGILLIQKIPEIHKKRRSFDKDFRENIRFYFSQKRMRDVYILSAGINMWWVFVFVFMTLFLKESGYTSSQIGLLLTLSQLPLFLFEFKSYMVFEKFRYRKPIVISYTLMSLILLVAFISGLNPTTLALFIIGSICLAIIEPAREMYLYEKLPSTDEERIQPVFATAEIIGSIAIRMSIGVALFFLSSTTTFGIMAFIMAIIAWHSRTLHD